MDSILMSIHPKHCWNIFRGIKTIEVRKHVPKNGAPFKVHIYCTSIKSMNLQDYCEIHKSTGGIVDDWSSKVIGEFICDKIDEYECEFVDNDCLETVYLIDREDCDDEDYPDRTLIWSNEGDNYNFSPNDEIIKGSRVSYKELKKYIGYGFNTFYGLHISDLKIYDEPKELSDFIVPSKSGCVNEGKCSGCIYFDKGNGFNIEDDCKAPFCTDEYKPLRRPPQSWCYVRELKGDK